MLLNFFKNQKADSYLKKCEKDLILGTVLISLRQITNDLSQGIGKNYNKEQKLELMVNCLKDVEKTIQANDKLTAIRTKTVDWLCQCAQYNVLITETQNSEKYVSGELVKHLDRIVEVNEDINKFIYGIHPRPVSIDEIKNQLIVQYWVLHLYSAAYNAARCAMKDYSNNVNSDWFRACYKSYLIWWEDNFRKELNLPSVFTEEKSELKLICLSSWWSIVNKNPEDMRKEFEQSWFNVFQEIPEILNE